MLDHEAGLAGGLQLREQLLALGFRRIHPRRHSLVFRAFLRTQDRTAEVAGQWRTELRRIAIARGKFRERVGGLPSHRLRELAVVHGMPEHLRLQGHPGDAHQACRSEEHTSELQSLMRISYAVFCLKKKKKT